MECHLTARPSPRLPSPKRTFTLCHSPHKSPAPFLTRSRTRHLIVLVLKFPWSSRSPSHPSLLSLTSLPHLSPSPSRCRLEQIVFFETSWVSVLAGGRGSASLRCTCPRGRSAPWALRPSCLSPHSSPAWTGLGTTRGRRADGPCGRRVAPHGGAGRKQRFGDPRRDIFRYFCVGLCVCMSKSAEGREKCRDDDRPAGPGVGGGCRGQARENNHVQAEEGSIGLRRIGGLEIPNQSRENEIDSG